MSGAEVAQLFNMEPNMLWARDLNSFQRAQRLEKGAPARSSNPACIQQSKTRLPIPSPAPTAQHPPPQKRKQPPKLQSPKEALVVAMQRAIAG